MGHPSDGGDDPSGRAEVIRSPAVNGGVGGGGGSRKRGHPTDLRTLFSSMRVSSFSRSVGGGGAEFAARPPLTRAASLAAAAGAGGASHRPTLTRAASLASAVAPSMDARRWREARVEEEGGSSPSPSPPGLLGGSPSADDTPHRPDEEEEDPEVSASRLADVLRASLRLGEDVGADDHMFMEMADAMIRCKIRNAANNNSEDDDAANSAEASASANVGGATDSRGAGAGGRAGAPSGAERGRRIDPTAEAASGRTGRPGPGVASAFSSARRLDVDLDDDDEGDAIGSSSAGSSSDEWVRVEEEISGSGEAASMVREDLAEATRRGVERIHIDGGGDRGGVGGVIDDHRGDASAEAAATAGGGKDDDLDGGEGADHPTTPAAAGATTAATPSIRLRSAEIGRSCPSFWSAGTGGYPSPPPDEEDDDEYLARPLDDVDDDGAGGVGVDVHVHEGESGVGGGGGVGPPSSSPSGGDGGGTTNESRVDGCESFAADGEAAAASGAAAAAKTTTSSAGTAATTTPHVRVVRFADARLGGADGAEGGDEVNVLFGTKDGGLRSAAGATTATAAAIDPDAASTTPGAAAAETVPQFLRVDPSEIKFDAGINYTPKNVSSNATLGAKGGATPHTVTKGGKMRRKASPRVAVRPRATTPSTAFKFAFAPPPQPAPQPHPAGDVGGGFAPSHGTNGNFGGTSTVPGTTSQPSASAPFAAAATVGSGVGVGGGYATNEPASVPAPAQVPLSNGAGATAATAPLFPSATGPPPTTATAAPSVVPGFAVDLKSSRSTTGHGHGHGRRRGSAMRHQQRKSSLVRNASSGSGGAVGAGTGSGGLPGGAVAADTAAARPSIPGFPVDATTGVHAASSSFARATSCGSAGGHGAQTSSAAAPTGGPPGVHFPQQPHPSQHPQHPPQSHLPQQPHPQPPPPPQQQQQQTQQQSNHEAVDGNLFSPMSIGSCGGGGDATASGGTPTFTVGLSPPSRSNQRKKATNGGGRRGRSASFRHQRTAHLHSQQRRSATAATMRGEAAAATANADVDRPHAHPEVPAAAAPSVPKEIFTHGVPAMNTTAAATTGRGHDATTGPGVVEGSAVGAGAAAGVAATEPAAPAADYTGRNARAASLREEARDHYTSGDYRSSVNAYTQAIAVVAGGPGHSSRPPDDKEMLAVLHGNRGAALMMLGAYRAAAEDCGVALSMVDATLRTGRRLSPDGGPTQASKLYGRMGRAHLKSGMINDASRAFSTAVDIAERARSCLREGLVEDDDRGRAEQVLGHTVNDATLGLAEIVRCKEAMRCSSLPYIQPVQVLHHVDKVLAVCPGSTEFHNRKITTLAALKRWFDVALACERLACDALRFEGVFVGDLRSMDPFARLSPATNLNADHFRDELSSSRKPLGAKEAAEAVLRLPSSLQPVYLRALRLEERYTEASKASTSLEVFAGTTSPRYGTQEQFAWIHGEREKLKRTTSTKERGDRNFRKGEYARAVDNYTVCLSVDSETAATQEDNAGGRLHAVLFCNRAACFMALRKYGAAARDCTAALRIQPFYMKATLRRGRCYARMERFEASIADYKKWIDFVAKPDAALRAFDLTSAVPPGEVERVKQELADVKRSMRDFVEKQRAEAQAREREEHRRWYKENFPRHRWNTSGTGSPHQRKHGGHHNNGSRAEGRRDSRDRSGSRNDGHDQQRTNPHTDESANHYNVLQVRRNCSTADIKKAYRKMALKYHPDKNKDPDAADIFRRVNAAYNVLSDNNSRRQYDISLRLGCH